MVNSTFAHSKKRLLNDLKKLCMKGRKMQYIYFGMWKMVVRLGLSVDMRDDSENYVGNPKLY